MRRAKIVATIGPATDSSEQLRALIQAGMDVARINMSHGERSQHAEVIRQIREVAGDLDKPVAVLLDLSGPKIRTGKLEGGQAELQDGAAVSITIEEVLGNSRRFSINYPRVTQEMKPGDRLLIGDGEIELKVMNTSATEVEALVVHGGTLGNHKGIALPGARLSIPSVTEKDEQDLAFGIAQGVDLVALSFVRSAEDCRHARELITAHNSRARLIAKIEKPEAVEDIENILDEADGVMVARGDLAVETSPEIVPILQKKIIACAARAQKTVITATQMLQSMIQSPRPTRAEASDVANAILDGSDALMLSGETAIGRFPIESVGMMDRIIRSAESTADELSRRRTLDHPLRRHHLQRQTGSYGRAIAEAASFAAREMDCRLIIVFTQSGQMARCIAAQRPRQRIIALTPNSLTYRQLALTWGVEAYPYEGFSPVSEEMLANADRELLRHGLAENGDVIVVMAGRMKDAAISNSMKLHRIGHS